MPVHVVYNLRGGFSLIDAITGNLKSWLSLSSLRSPHLAVNLDCRSCILLNEDMAMPERHGGTEKDSVALTQLRRIGYF